MKQSLQDFLQYGLNEIEANSNEYAEGERYIGNDNSDFSCTMFTSKEEAGVYYTEAKNEEDKNKQ